MILAGSKGHHSVLAGVGQLLLSLFKTSIPKLVLGALLDGQTDLHCIQFASYSG